MLFKMKRFINLSFITLLLMSFVYISCKKDQNCNVSDPIEELAWLKESIDEVKHDEYSYFMMAKYKKETVFYYGNCNPAINYVSYILNCNGEQLGYTNELYNDLTDIKLIWEHESGRCTFQ